MPQRTQRDPRVPVMEPLRYLQAVDHMALHFLVWVPPGGEGLLGPAVGTGVAVAAASCSAQHGSSPSQVTLCLAAAGGVSWLDRFCNERS